MIQSRVPGFLPSTSGLPFSNSWPHAALLGTITLPGHGPIALGDAANGLCGGMSFAVRDLFTARWARASAAVRSGGQPIPGSPRFEYLVQRQLASFNGIAVPLELFRLMSPARQDRESGWGGLLASAFGLVGIDRHSRAWVMTHRSWPAVRAEIDLGSPAVLGLVRAISLDVRDLGRHHQVLAYGYALDGPELVLEVYDPNHPDDDSIRLAVSLSTGPDWHPPAYSAGDGPVRCFIRIDYAPADPAPWH